MSSRIATPWSAPLWQSAFRPFYLLGALYGPLLMIAWAGAYAGLWNVPAAVLSPSLWHGHEIIYGFAAAIISGIVLTALSTWAETPEVSGRRLALVIALWCAGRLAVWVPGLPVAVAGTADTSLFAVLGLLLAPQLLRAHNKWYLLLLPILAGLWAGNVAFYAGLAAGSDAPARFGLRLAIHSIILLYVLKGGVLTPIFTGNALREKGRGDQAPFKMGLEVVAVASVLLLAALDLAGAPARWTGASAAACALVHAWRVARWKGWRLADTPLVFVMHLGFAWLVASFALKAVADLTGAIPEATWVHAFSVGSLGMMMLGLMTRVTLRHTGRPLAVPRPMLAGYGSAFAAALLRVAATALGLGDWAVTLSALLWAAPFALYLALFAAVLVRPSMPRADPVPAANPS
jgi:uncharacterized protein involved in response to NO